MNVIFSVICLASAAALALTAPDKLLTSLMDGAETSLKTGAALFCIYAVWMGLSALADKSGLSRGVARGLRPLTRRLFKCDDGEINQCLSMNLSCNLLGLGGAATPYAVKAVNLLEKKNGDYAQKLLFVINATSVQILPTTVIALRASAGSANPADIFLPSLICTALSTFIAVAAFMAGRKLWR